MRRAMCLSLSVGAAIGLSAGAAFAAEENTTNQNAGLSADETRALVAEMLADAETRSSLLQNSATAGHDGKFFLASPDGNFRLNIGGQIQFRYNTVFLDDDTRTAGDDEVDYTVLMTDSEQFRGRPLSVEGVIRRIDRVTIGAREVEKGYPLEHYYVAWIFTESSGNSPYRLVAVGIPEDMPTGEDIEVPVKFTGYFFKREGYRSEQGFHKAPVLIGKQIRWHRPEVATEQLPQDSGLAPYAIGLAVLIAVGISLMIWRFNVSDKKFGHKHVEHFITASPSAIEELQKLQTSDVSDLFRQMQEEAIAADLESANSETEQDSESSS